jgi:hypothetical protein
MHVVEWFEEEVKITQKKGPRNEDKINQEGI